MNAACSRAGPIVDFVHKTKGQEAAGGGTDNASGGDRGGVAGGAGGASELLPHANRKFSMMDQFELGVEADVTSSGVDSVRLVAGEAQPNNLGYLRLRLLRFGDDARGKSLRVNLVGGIKLPRSSVYVKGTVISSSGIATGTKFKSQVRPSQPTTVVAALAMSCTALHCTALHCTALHCTALHCTALHCTALHCTALHCTALALHCTALALHCTALRELCFFFHGFFPTRRWLTFLRAYNCARVTFVPSRSPSSRPFVEQVVKGSFNPTFDEGFTVPNCTDGICVVMRVYDDASTGVFSTLFGRGNSCLGEVLLDLTIASELEGEAVLDFPLHPIECVAPASSLTQHALFCSSSVLCS
jgi:hypothetical protein